MVEAPPTEHVVAVRKVSRLPVHPAWLAVILLGGTAGTAIRAALETALAPPAGQWPWVTFWINVSGALILGIILESLTASGPDLGWRRGVRLGVGTGVMGGFTTYSTFAVETLNMIRAGAVLPALGYGLGSVVTGVAVAAGGASAVRRIVRARHRRSGATR